LPSDCILTLDVDWAPDFVIEDVANLLRQHHIRSTWFVTHASPAIEALADEPDLFELGIHPNFLPGSSHGVTHDEVIGHCRSIVPDAISCRTHALAQSAAILDALVRHRIQIDTSLLLFGAKDLAAVPYYSESGTIHRVPYIWEDCCELHQPNSQRSQTMHLLARGGLKVFAFHPIHIFLNSKSMDDYRLVTEGSAPLQELPRDAVLPFINKGAGTGTMFRELVEWMHKTQRHGCVRDLLADDRAS